MKIYLTILLVFSCLSNSFSQQKDTLSLEVTSPNGLAISGDILFIVESLIGKVSKLNINNPTASKEDVITGMGRPVSLVLKGNDLYISDIQVGVIVKFDITETNPVLETVISGINNPNFIALNGNDLFITTSGGQILKADISQVDPILETVFSGVANIADIAIQGNDLFYTEYSLGRISKIDLSQENPTPEVVISGLNTPFSLGLNGDKLYFGELDNLDISYIDISETNPTKINFDMNTSVRDFIFHEDYLYISNFHFGLILRYSDVPTPILDLENSKDELNVFPNPTSDFISIDNLRSATKYSIFDAQGRSIREAIVHENELIDVKKLEAGLYYIYLKDKEVLKFVKE